MLPAVAVRAVMNRDAVAILETRNLWEVIANPGGDERHPRADFLMVLERGFKKISEVRQLGDCRLPWFDAIRTQFLAPEPEEFQRRYAVTTEKAMQHRRVSIARSS